MTKTMNKNKDLSQTLKGYENKWVVLTPDYERVVSSGDELNETMSRVEQTQKDKVVFFKVIPPSYVPTTL